MIRERRLEVEMKQKSPEVQEAYIWGKALKPVHKYMCRQIAPEWQMVSKWKRQQARKRRNQGRWQRSMPTTLQLENKYLRWKEVHSESNSQLILLREEPALWKLFSSIYISSLFHFFFYLFKFLRPISWISLNILCQLSTRINCNSLNLICEIRSRQA